MGQDAATEPNPQLSEHNDETTILLDDNGNLIPYSPKGAEDTGTIHDGGVTNNIVNSNDVVNMNNYSTPHNPVGGEAQVTQPDGWDWEIFWSAMGAVAGVLALICTLFFFWWKNCAAAETKNKIKSKLPCSSKVAESEVPPVFRDLKILQDLTRQSH